MTKIDNIENKSRIYVLKINTKNISMEKISSIAR